MKAQKPVYKYCIVPECKNTIRSAPHKVFFPVPIGEKRRKEWCKVIRRDDMSPTTCVHCCEDHFNIEEDTENYIQYHIMKQEGVFVTLRLNKGVLPHKFHCRNRIMPPNILRTGAIMRKRLALMEEALAESAASSSDVLEISEPPQTNNDEAESSSSHIEQIHSSENETKMFIDKAVQVKIRAKFRSKGVNVNFPMDHTNKNFTSKPQDVSREDNSVSTVPETESIFVMYVASQMKQLPKSVCNMLMQEIKDLVDSKRNSDSFSVGPEETSCDFEDMYVKAEMDIEEFVIQDVKEEIL